MCCIGTSLGTAISIPTSGVIAGSLGWEAVFYIHGGLAVIWCILWAIFVTDDAASHPFMSEEEKKFIEENHAAAKKTPLKVFSGTICLLLVTNYYAQFTYL